MTAAVDRRRLRRNFDSSAASYDRHARVQSQVVEHLLQLLQQYCPHVGLAIEVGCGTGRLSRGLREIRPQLQRLVSDIAHGMTLHARVLNEGGMAVDAAAEALPFADACAALVCSSSVYQWVVDLPGAFSESARVLAPEGLFAFALFGQKTLWELKAAYRLAAEEAGGPTRHLHSLPDRAAVVRALEGAGFCSVDLQRQELVEYHRDARDLLRSLKQIGAGNASPAAPRGLASRRLLQVMADHYRCQYGRDGLLPATYEVYYGLAMRPRADLQGAIRRPAG